MNRVILIGRLTADPELKGGETTTSFCSFSVAVDRKYKDADGNRQADFINTIAWGKTAEFIAKYFRKGNKIAITGRLEVRKWEDREGNKRSMAEVIAEEAEFVENNSRDGSHIKDQQPAKSDLTPDTPFEI